MSSSCIEIETECLQTDIVQMTEAVQDAKKKSEAMFTTIQELDTMWDGPANEIFRAQFLNDHTAMQELCGEVENLISCMEFAKKSYEQCEEEVYEKVLSLKLEGDA
ncbi:hypothetical protein OBV_34260 [Oscillibacter valericigenes Sjm18-20]|nr:hypothetical protein OBV_34260 [Oscillibacter valericigenes Sjm18-20]